MKSTFFSLLLVFLGSFTLSAQVIGDNGDTNPCQSECRFWRYNWGFNTSIFREGKVGIGLDNYPSYPLHVKGNFGLNGSLLGLQTNGALGIFANTNDSNGAYLRLYGSNAAASSGQITLSAGVGGNVIFFNRTSNSWQKNMTIFSTGKVAIGTDNTPSTLPGEDGDIDVSYYRLFVQGGILTNEVRVATEWADYVFRPDYRLMPLREVEQFIQARGHLPNVPSEAEVEQQGIEIGDISKIQQEKIEELFLHVIALEKRVAELERENTLLKAKN